MDDDDRVDARLAALDPAAAEAVPAPGSARYRSILETAMHDTPALTATPHRSPARRPWRLAAAAAAAVLVALGVTVLRPGATPSAAAATIQAAADVLADTTSLRGTLRNDYPDGEVWTFEAEVDGDDNRQVATITAADGSTTTFTLTVVDDVLYTEQDGQVTTEQLGPDDRLHPFGASSAAVIGAVLSGGDVEEVGPEQVSGSIATRFHLALDDGARAALAALAPGQLSWFGLEDPDLVESVDVWVAGDLVLRIDVAFADGYFLERSSTELRDFGADIEIVAPPSS